MLAPSLTMALWTTTGSAARARAGASPVKRQSTRSAHLGATIAFCIGWFLLAGAGSGRGRCVRDHWQQFSERLLILFTRADADDLLDGVDEDLAVADLAGAG